MASGSVPHREGGSTLGDGLPAEATIAPTAVAAAPLEGGPAAASLAGGDERESIETVRELAQAEPAGPETLAGDAEPAVQTIAADKPMSPVEFRSGATGPAAAIPAGHGRTLAPEPDALAFPAVRGAVGEGDALAPVRPRRAPAPLVLTSIDAPTHRLAPAGIGAAAPIETAAPIRDDSWMRAMIDQIETAVEGTQREARIRLSPDALGTVEVRISNGSDGVAVQLTADNPATRALLAEGAPRLAELADARGLRLSQAQVDAGSSGGGRGQHSPQQSAAAVPNRAPARDDQPGPRDARLA